jgi:hypothetical protein
MPPYTGFLSWKTLTYERAGRIRKESDLIAVITGTPTAAVKRERLSAMLATRGVQSP